jgi:hypothetical protein
MQNDHDVSQDVSKGWAWGMVVSLLGCVLAYVWMRG